MKTTKKSIITFLIICFGLSGIFYYLLIAHNFLEGNVAYLLMWCPGVAAIMTSRLYHRKENAMMFRKVKWRYILIGLGLPLIYWGISYGIYLLIYGTGTIIENNMAMQLFQSPATLIIYMAIFFLSGMGEEIGWRGYLTPKLNELFGPKKGVFLSGVIWCLWHLPVYASGYASDLPIWYQLPALLVLIFILAFPFYYLSMKTKSVWPAVCLHFTHNFIAQIMLDQSIGGEMRPYLAGETGIISIVLLLFIAVISYNKLRKLSN